MVCEVTENTIVLNADTLYLGELAGFGDNDSYKFSMSENETITFNIKLQNNTAGTLPRGTVTLYRIEDENINLGTSHLRSVNNRFTYDGIVGDYFFCIENVYPSTYELLVEFTDYNGIIFTNMNGLSGEFTDADWPEDVVPPCTMEVSFKIIDGNLPLNIAKDPLEEFVFHSAGIISGTAGEQDCESESDEAPSWNWKKYDSAVGITATYKPYPIKVRAYLTNYPFVYVDKWVQVCVHNNWSYDEPDILNLQRTEYDVSYIDVELPNQSVLCPPCMETKEIITERVIEFKKYDIEGFMDQMDKLMYEKQCKERHKLPELDDIYHEAEVVVEIPPTLCPICPDDK